MILREERLQCFKELGQKELEVAGSLEVADAFRGVASIVEVWWHRSSKAGNRGKIEQCLDVMLVRVLVSKHRRRENTQIRLELEENAVAVQ